MTAYDETKVQQLESQNRSLTEQMTLYKQALADYKKALTSLGEKVVQEEQRTMELSNKIAAAPISSPPRWTRIHGRRPRISMTSTRM